MNRLCITGNLTKDPEAVGESSARLRVANNQRVKRGDEWVDEPGFYDVFVPRGTHVLQYLSRGRQVAIDGRLQWREWETDDGQKRQAVSIVADNVEFIGGSRSDGDSF